MRNLGNARSNVVNAAIPRKNWVGRLKSWRSVSARLFTARAHRLLFGLMFDLVQEQLVNEITATYSITTVLCSLIIIQLR